MEETARRQRRMRVAPTIVALASLLVIAGCGGAQANPNASASSATQHANSGSGPGPATVGGQAPGGDHPGNRSAGVGFSLAFARCMRAHGVPKFPDPGGKARPLGPGIGFDPASRTFQAAVNGPCRPLAPPAWVSSGQVSNGGS